MSNKYLKFRSIRNNADESFYEDFNREQVLGELKSCQERTLQTLVPTIIAVGLIAIADREKFALITLVSAFAVLFGSSLYIASLAYKIFRNGTYLKVLDEYTEPSTPYSWGRALNKFQDQTKAPGVIGYETKTISIVYLVFSGAFFLMFYEMHLWLALGLGTILGIVAYRIFSIPKMSDDHIATWRQVFKDIEAEQKGVEYIDTTELEEVG